MPDNCPGCEHDLDLHYRSLAGNDKCLAEESGVSTSGIMGLPWNWHCDCTNGVSEYADRIRERRRAEDAERQEYIDKLVAAVKFDDDEPKEQVN